MCVCVCVCVCQAQRQLELSSKLSLNKQPPSPTNYHHKGDVVLPLSVTATPRRFKLIRIPWERSKIEV
jgi:hypothetical protein